ncbi:MAG: type II toxin-antitoxin system Phd/YefM family antitoxin [bacterium]|nr:type II toxin-antitoxin system Phd/YefM family antitoxin [bacterium]
MHETAQTALIDPLYVEEPNHVQEYVDVFSRVAVENQPVIVRRRGEDVAAVISLAQLSLLQELLARQQAELLAAEMDWSSLDKAVPPQEWLDGDEPKPF